MPTAADTFWPGYGHGHFPPAAALFCWLTDQISKASFVPEAVVIRWYGMGRWKS